MNKEWKIMTILLLLLFIIIVFSLYEMNEQIKQENTICRNAGYDLAMQDESGNSRCYTYTKEERIIIEARDNK